MSHSFGFRGLYGIVSQNENRPGLRPLPEIDNLDTAV
jgi:hypothetical protein